MSGNGFKTGLMAIMIVLQQTAVHGKEEGVAPSVSFVVAVGVTSPETAGRLLATTTTLATVTVILAFAL